MFNKPKNELPEQELILRRLRRLEEDVEALKNPPKYNIGDSVYFLHGGNFFRGQISNIDGQPSWWIYSFMGRDITVMEANIFLEIPKLKS